MDRRLLVIFLTVFIDLVGFGIIIPMNPYLAHDLGATEFQIGLLMAIYSFMQFVMSPVWGKLSDRIGRRPILLMSILGVGLSFLGFAFAQSLWMLFAARFFAGVFGANISTTMAYIADISDAKSRSKNMGLIGAAFGLGFIFGPILGGLLSIVGQKLGSNPPFGMYFPALGAAALSIGNFISAWFFLKESKTHIAGPRAKRWDLFNEYFRRPVVGRLMAVYFLMSLAIAHMEAMLFLFVKDKFNWGLKESSFGFAFVGFVMVFTQGFLIRKIIPKFGERRVLMMGLALLSLGLLGTGVSGVIGILALFQILTGLGYGLSNPSISGSISLLSGKEEQGAVMGTTQSLSALGRILGPVSGGFLYQTLGPGMPFYAGGILTFVALLLLWPIRATLPDPHKL